MKITKKFLFTLWRFESDGHSVDIEINTLRLFMYIYKNWNDDYIIHTTMPELYRDVFSYLDDNNKRKYLINSKKFKDLISDTKFTAIGNNKEVTINFNHDLFIINGSKKDAYEKKQKAHNKKNPFDPMPDYQEGSYITIKDNIWYDVNLIKSSYLHKLYLYILYHKARGQYQYIQTTVEDIQYDLMITQKEKKQVKQKLKKELDYLVSTKIIHSYKFDMYKLTIQKYGKQ